MTRIEEIAAREKAATPGDYYDSAGDVFQEDTRERVARCTSLSRSYADARFFAHAREDIPYLLAQLEDTRESQRQRMMSLDCYYGDGYVAPRQRCGQGDFRRGNCLRHYNEAVLERGIAVYRILKGGE